MPYFLILALCLFCALHMHPALVDDGFIAHRYAANLLHGHGLVFTVGQRVEGISDPGWTLLMVLPQVFHWRPELFAMAVGFVCMCAALLVAYHFAVHEFHVARELACGVVCASTLNANLWLMTLNGIESSLYALTLIGGFAFFVRRRLLWAGATLGFATTLRPESVPLAPLTLICIGGLTLGQSRDLPAAWRAMWNSRALLLPWAAIVFPVLACRHAYYGEWLPNTVIAKAHPLHLSDLWRGLAYLARFAAVAAPWTLLPLFAFPRRPVLLPALVALSWFAFQVVVVLGNGGDWMTGHRLIGVYFPFLVLFSAFGLQRLLQGFVLPRWFALGATGLAVLAVQTSEQIHARIWTLSKGVVSRHELLDLMPPIFEPPFIRLAWTLKPVLRPTDVVSPEVLGIFSYILLDTPMHDWLGLVDAYVAHHGTVYYPTFGKADPVYSMDVVAPTLFAFDTGLSTLNIFQTQTNGRFMQRYSCWQVVGQPVIVAIRRDREPDILPALRQSTFRIVPILPGTPPG